MVDHEGPWGLRLADHDCTWGQIIPKLHELESQTWGELYGQKNGSTHPMPVTKIEKEAQQRLQEIGQDQWDTLFQINVRGGIRLWGIRDRAIFHLLWYDPSHTVYVQRT